MATEPASASPPPPPPLQFDRVESPAALVCAGCKSPIQNVYFTINNRIICARCRDNLVATINSGFPVARFATAALYGLGGGIAGAALWFAVRRLTGITLGLIAIVLGYLVGIAVRKASKGRGGLPYQFLAVAITYLCIAGQYVPDIYAYAKEWENTAASTAFLFAIKEAFILPITMGRQNFIGLIIIAFALWEAWKFNRKGTLDITGPHAISPSLPTSHAPHATSPAQP